MATATSNASNISAMPAMNFGGSASSGAAALPQVLCCVCGALTPPNPKNKCVSCLREEIDISANVCRTFVVDHCRQCSRFKDAQGKWLACQIESRELLALCLKKIKGLKSLSRIIDCRWLFTEPHSNKLALRITAQADVLEGAAVAEQSFNIQGLIHHMQCDECKKAFTPHAGWTASVQVRQRTEHKRTFLFLEQLVLQQQPILQKLLSVVQRKDGLDFHFPNRQTAAAFSAFCCSRFPCKTRSSKQLISHDASSNTYFYKYTIYVELAPVCKDDLVFIPGKKTKEAFGGFSSISLCSRVACGVQFVDPFTARQLDLSADVYFRDPIQAVCTRKHLSHFVVLSVTPLSQAEHHQNQHQQHKAKKKGRKVTKTRGSEEEDMIVEVTTAESESPSSAVPREEAGKFRLAEVELMRCSPQGVVEGSLITTRTHLGAVLQSGDFVSGYDVSKINLSGFVDSAVEADVLWPSSRRGGLSSCEEGLRAAPFEVIVVKKYYPFRKPGKRRPWVLRSLQKEQAEADAEDGLYRQTERRKRPGAERGASAKNMELETDDAEQFKRDLEEDAELRRHVAIFRDPRIDARKKVGAAGITGIGSSSSRNEKTQKKKKSSETAKKSRKLSFHESQARKTSHKAYPEEEDALGDGKEFQESEGDWTSSDEEEGAAPEVDLSEMLEGLTLEDLKPVTPGQGVTDADREVLLGQDERDDEL